MSIDGEGVVEAPMTDWGEIFGGGMQGVFVSPLSSPPDDDAEPAMAHVVTAGSYSDYDIVDVFADENEAQALVNEMNGPTATWYEGDARVESYVLRERNAPYRQQWDVTMRLSGEAIHVQNLGGRVMEYQPFAATRTKTLHAGFVNTYKITDDLVWRGRCFAVDEQHATKIAMEKLMQWKAQNL